MADSNIHTQQLIMQINAEHQHGLLLREHSPLVDQQMLFAPRAISPCNTFSLFEKRPCSWHKRHVYPYGVVRLKKKVACNRKDVSNRLCNYKWAGIRALALAYDMEPLFKERVREQRRERGKLKMIMVCNSGAGFFLTHGVWKT